MQFLSQPGRQLNPYPGDCMPEALFSSPLQTALNTALGSVACVLMMAYLGQSISMEEGQNTLIIAFHTYLRS